MKCHEIRIAQCLGPTFALAFTCVFALALALAEAFGVALESFAAAASSASSAPVTVENLIPVIVKCDI